MCASEGISLEEVSEVSLSQMLSLEGVGDNECLRRRREELFAVSRMDASVAL